MAELVTSESRRYLHGIQNTIISDDDTGVALNIIPSDSQLALVDKMEVDGTLTVYGDAYVTSSKNADLLSGVNHNEIAGRDVYAAHPASAVSLVPVGSVVATDMQSAVAELDAGKVASNPPLSPSTKTKITYDSKGLVTSGSNATASDIANVPYGGVVAVNVQDAINAVESHAASAQTAANNAAADAAYADRLARSSYNLIKNGNSEDADPAGYEAVGISAGNPYTGTKSRRTYIPPNGTWHGFDVTPKIPCAPGDQFYFEAMVADWNGASYISYIGIKFYDASGAYIGVAFSPNVTVSVHVKTSVNATAPSGAASVVFFCESSGGPNIYGDNGWFDCLYACRKVSAGMLEADILKAIMDASVYADTLARSNNLIKNGNSEDPNPTGYEAAWISDSGAYTGTKCRALTVAANGSGVTKVGEAPCKPGDRFVFSAWVKQSAASDKQRIVIGFWNAAGSSLGDIIKDCQASTAYTQVDVFAEAPAGAAKVDFGLYAAPAPSATTYYWDYLYAELKFPAVVLEGGLTGTKTFYAASSSGGSATVLNTVVVKNGIITSWTQA